MLNPYQIYHNPVPGTSNFLQLEPDMDSTSPSDDRNKRRCLIAAYKEYYNTLTSTKSSQGKKTMWEDILKQFQSMCFDNGVESEKSLVQLKEKWRALMDKHRSVCDSNNRTGRERKRSNTMKT